MKRWLCVFLAMLLVISLLPVAAMAKTSAVTVVEGPITSGRRTRSAGSLPELDDQAHVLFIDRVSNFPDYALDFYNWLESNADADGALADPARAENNAYGYYHTVGSVTDSVSFTVTDFSTLYTTAEAAANTAFANVFESFSSFAGAVYDAFDRDHPEVFWLNGQSAYSYQGAWYYSYMGNICTVYIDMSLLFYLQYSGFDVRMENYRSTTAVANGIAFRDQLVSNILLQCPAADPVEQIRYLNQTLTWNNAYNHAVGSGNWTAADAEAWKCISALEGRSGIGGPVCEGYARAFKVLCDRLGIPCVLTDGASISYLGDTPEDHMWNYVQVDGKWYAMDVTWNDPYITNMPDRTRSGFESETWFLLSADTLVSENLTFLESHKVENNVSISGLYFTNGPELYDSTAVTGVSLSGTVTSYGAVSDVTVELWAEGALAASARVSGNKAAYTLENIAPGSYTLKVAKQNHVTREYAVTVGSEDAVQDATICLIGDVSCDGRVNVGDVAKLYSHVRGSAPLTDPYALACANVNGGSLNIGDAAKLYSHVRGTSLLY